MKLKTACVIETLRSTVKINTMQMDSVFCKSDLADGCRQKENTSSFDMQKEIRSSQQFCHFDRNSQK